jgi:hypothetical protein
MSEQTKCEAAEPTGPIPRCAKHKVDLLRGGAVEVGHVHPNPHDQDVEEWVCPVSSERILVLGKRKS